MGYLLLTVNLGDRIAGLYRRGQCPAVIAQDLLEELDFNLVHFTDRTIIAWHRGVRFELDGSFVSPALEAA